MFNITTIARRELSSLFFSPIAYVVLALFALGASWIFLMSFGPGEPATLRSTFGGIVWLMIFLVPAISMRLISDEVRSGTLELLMTSPLSDAQVVLGKWLGAMGFYAVLLSPLLIQAIVLEAFAQPDHGPMVTGFIGLLLVGGLYLAIGTFASTLTQNQIIAFLVTVFIICILTFVTFFVPRAANVWQWLRDTMFYLNINSQYEDFTKGLIDTSNVAYFVVGTALFLFFAVLSLESRRWR